MAKKKSADYETYTSAKPRPHDGSGGGGGFGLQRGPVPGRAHHRTKNAFKGRPLGQRTRSRCVDGEVTTTC